MKKVDEDRLGFEARRIVYSHESRINSRRDHFEFWGIMAILALPWTIGIAVWLMRR